MKKIAIIGGGYCGLAAGYDLAKAGFEVSIFEKDSQLGGLAGTFEIAPGKRLEKFYHHWFSSDVDILNFIEELGLIDKVKFSPSRTGFYYSNSIFRLASPWDLLKFTPLPLVDRVRTGLMALYARSINSWAELEKITAKEWIIKVAGRKSFDVIWAPMLQGKFGDAWEDISAVWFWNKLKLRGSSRKGAGEEKLAYFDGGFGALLDGIEGELKKLGVKFFIGQEPEIKNNLVVNNIEYDHVLFTTPLPVFLNLVQDLPRDYIDKLKQIKFLGNICLVLKLKRSLSDSYWLNVADPSFPFVGLIEHTNIDSKDNYGGSHIAYLSKYLPDSDPLFAMDEVEFFNYSAPHLQKIFPEFDATWLESCYLWKAQYSQPLVTKNYSKLIPAFQTPLRGVWLSTMAQIYPEDRGTNYAIKYGRMVAQEIKKAA